MTDDDDPRLASSGVVRGTPRADYAKLAGDARVLLTEDPVYIDGTKAFRPSCA